ncbi:elongin-B-like [Orcinus orca]|uniref:elongin-B-like n=1 Tax=Orcinus orca TaxID=9733 RepID=UPI00211285C4|nr:elongin-B-like [Orcinus orca]
MREKREAPYQQRQEDTRLHYERRAFQITHFPLIRKIKPDEAGRGGAGVWAARKGAELPASRRGEAVAGVDVFLKIRRRKTIIFMEGKASSTMFLLKRIVEGILKQLPDEQRLYKDHRFLDDGKILGECGFTSQTQPRVGLALQAGEAFETLPIKPFSSPPELPDVMKPQDPGSSANEQAVQ